MKAWYLLFCCIFLCCTNKQKQIQLELSYGLNYDSSLAIDRYDSLVFNTTPQERGYPQYADSTNSFFKFHNDTLFFHTTGWFEGSFIFQVKIVNDSCKADLDFFDDHRQYIYTQLDSTMNLNKKSFTPGHYLIASFHYIFVGKEANNKSLHFDSVFLNGKIKLKVRDSSFTFGDLSIENSRNEFYSLLKQRPDTIKKLSLFGCAFTSLPPELVLFKNLEELTLDGNNLSKSDFTNLGKLINLKSLDLNECNLSKFPNSILILSRLENLSIWNNQISTIPEGLYNMTSLKELTIGNNKLTYLSPKISNLKNLKSLETSFTEIRRYPDEMVKLKNLIEIYPSDTMEYIPKPLIKYVWGCDTILNK